jgi:ABC-2 type transport system permease protein
MTGDRSPAAALRLLVLGGWLSFRALFPWLTPGLFLPVMVVTPALQVVVFAAFGEHLQSRPAGFFILGNAVLVCSVPCVYGPMLAAFEERGARVLPLVLMSPARRGALMVGRALPFAGNGLLVSGLALAVGGLLFGLDLPVSRVPLLVLALLVSALSCSGLGAALGMAGVLGRDVPFLSNLVTAAMLLVSGANVPIDGLPWPLRAVGEVLPLTHGIEAARSAAADAPAIEVAGLLGVELGIGAAYLALALSLFTWVDRRAREAGTLSLT